MIPSFLPSWWSADFKLPPSAPRKFAGGSRGERCGVMNSKNIFYMFSGDSSFGWARGHGHTIEVRANRLNKSRWEIYHKSWDDQRTWTYPRCLWWQWRWWSWWCCRWWRSSPSPPEKPCSCQRWGQGLKIKFIYLLNMAFVLLMPLPHPPPPQGPGPCSPRGRSWGSSPSAGPAPRTSTRYSFCRTDGIYLVQPSHGILLLVLWKVWNRK